MEISKSINYINKIGIDKIQAREESLKEYLIEKLIKLPHLDIINSEIDKLKKLKQQQEKPYRQNLFADPKFSDLLLTQIDEMVTQLEDQLVALNKQQARYEK